MYWSWKSGPWDLPTSSKTEGAGPPGGPQLVLAPRAPINTDIIVNKNLFDPERGAGATREAEANSQAFQRVRGMVLLGTMIVGNNRVAILQDGTPSGPTNPRNPAPAASLMRLKIGDNLDGFKLTEIAERKVVFAKNASRVEVVLDYFRKVEPPPPAKTVSPPRAQLPSRSAGVPVPRVVPNLPRRGQLPLPTTPSPSREP